jgi:hypothetical protein
VKGTYFGSKLLRAIAWFFALPIILLAGQMAVLAADRETSRKEGGLKNYPVGVDIIYKGGFVGVNAAGYLMAMPLVASATGYKFAGVADEKVDNSAGSAGDKFANVRTEGVFLFDATSITQAMVGQMMYLVDDHTFDDVPAAVDIAVGILVEYVSTTSGWIQIDAAVDSPAKQPKLGQLGGSPNLLNVVTKTTDYTVTDAESGTTFAIATDAKVFTLPATVRGLTYTFVNTGADAAVLLSVSPNANDKIMGGGLAATDNKDAQNTKATAKKYDYITIVGDGVDGWVITDKQGIWTTES